MRLLKRSTDGDFELVSFNNNVPPYAILSHTWDEDQEISHQDLVDHTGAEKSGHDQIRASIELASKDDLHYFWVDTCCTIQTHHRRQCPTKRVVYAAENGGGTYIAF